VTAQQGPGTKSLVTVLVYLTTLPEGCGGETYFPVIDKGFRPVRGRAVIWANFLPDGSTPDVAVIHGARAPLNGHHKRGIVFTITDRDYYRRAHFARGADITRTSGRHTSRHLGRDLMAMQGATSSTAADTLIAAAARAARDGSDDIVEVTGFGVSEISSAAGSRGQDDGQPARKRARRQPCCPVCGAHVPADGLQRHIQLCIRDPPRNRRDDLAAAT